MWHYRNRKQKRVLDLNGICIEVRYKEVDTFTEASKACVFNIDRPTLVLSGECITTYCEQANRHKSHVWNMGGARIFAVWGQRGDRTKVIGAKVRHMSLAAT